MSPESYVRTVSLHSPDRQYRSIFVRSLPRWQISVVCCILYAVTQLNHAKANTTDDMNNRFNDLRSQADRAVVYIGPHPGDRTFSFSMGEKDLPRIGCTYELDKDDVDGLLDLLTEGEIAIRDRRETINARSGIFVYDGRRLLLKLVFADAFSGERGMRGLLDGETPVMSGPALQDNLRAYAERFTPRSTNNGCEKGGVAIKPLTSAEQSSSYKPDHSAVHMIR